MTLIESASLGLVSLREPVDVNLIRRSQPTTAPSHSVGYIVTATRIPLAILGVSAMFSALPVLAVAAFCVFAGLDLMDGMVARARNEETALRRVFDVVVDRLAIQSAVIAVSVLASLPLWVPILMVLRDVVQAGYSSWFVIRVRQVVVGPHSHMLYGLTMLIWGCYSILTRNLDPLLTLGSLAVSLLVLIDYVRRCEDLRHNLVADKAFTVR